MADGRKMSQDELRQIIDRAPLLSEAALAAGLVDDLGYEDELAYLLAEKSGKNGDSSKSSSSIEKNKNSEEPSSSDNSGRPEVKLTGWSKAYPMLLEKPRRRNKKFIGVISLEGSIVMGSSQPSPIDLPIPFVGGSSAGEQTLVKLLRRAEKSENIAALIFHVDSGGGSSLASDLIGREIERVSQKKPVLVYMGNAAASGGYYISAPADHIMSQAGTLTGSIGAWLLHISTRDFYEAISVNRISMNRGQRAGLYRDTEPLSEEERQILQDSISDTYQKFKQVVSKGRDLPFDTLDPICEGRVWTGRQALKHKLVDSHGDFVDAINKVATLASLTHDDKHIVPVVNIFPKAGSYIPPKPFEASDWIADVGRVLTGEKLRELSGKPLMMMPYEIRLT